MPRPKDHRDVTVNTLVISQPRQRHRFLVHFESQTDLPQSTNSRRATFSSSVDSSTHRTTLVTVDGAGNPRTIGTVSWTRQVECTIHPARPFLEGPADEVDPPSTGLPTTPSRPPEGTITPSVVGGVNVTIQTWVDAAEGFSVTLTTSVTTSGASVQTITFRELATGTTFVGTLSAETVWLGLTSLTHGMDSPAQREPEP